MSDLRIQASVVIQEVLSDTSYVATLPNGKKITAYTRPLDHIPPLQAGDAYTVLLSLCDFNAGRLVPRDLQGVSLTHPVMDGETGYKVKP